MDGVRGRAVLAGGLAQLLELGAWGRLGSFAGRNRLGSDSVPDSPGAVGAPGGSSCPHLSGFYSPDPRHGRVGARGLVPRRPFRGRWAQTCCEAFLTETPRTPGSPSGLADRFIDVLELRDLRARRPPRSRAPAHPDRVFLRTHPHATGRILDGYDPMFPTAQCRGLNHDPTLWILCHRSRQEASLGLTATRAASAASGSTCGARPGLDPYPPWSRTRSPSSDPTRRWVAPVSQSSWPRSTCC
jgi:hypothetical protein